MVCNRLSRRLPGAKMRSVADDLSLALFTTSKRLPSATFSGLALDHHYQVFYADAFSLGLTPEAAVKTALRPWRLCCYSGAGHLKTYVRGNSGHARTQ